MSLTVGELNAYLRLNDTEFVRVINQSGAQMRQLGRIVDRELGRIDARFAALRPVITPTVDTAHLHAELDEIERRADRLSTLDPTIHIHVDSTRASTDLDRIERTSRRLGDDDGGGRAASGYARLASTLGSVIGPMGGAAAQAGLIALQLGAAVPVAAGLAAALVNIAPAAAVAATGVFALAQAVSVIKIGTGGLGAAFKAAFAPAVSGGGGAAGAANQAAKAMQAVKDATKQAAYANQQAARQTADAERNVTDAQKAARAAQLDLNASREQATRDLQDMNESLADAYLDQRQAVQDVQSAQEDLDAAKAYGAGTSQEDLARLQLAYDRAQQRLEEQTITTKRLKSDTDAANKAGVDGSQTMVDARAKVSDANRAVADQERALADARVQQARTAQQGLDAIRKAQEAMAQSASGAGGGVDQLAAALAALSPNARAFVLQAIALKGAWDKVKLAVQDRLFAGLAGELKSTATVLLPILQRNLVSSAGALNAMAKGAAAAARGVGKDGTLDKAMASASGGLMNLAGIPGIFIKALTQLAAAAGPTFLRLTSALGRGAAQVGSALDKAFKSGALEKAINVAVGLIKELGTIAGNVFSIIGSVMGAAQVTGGGFLGVLRDITGALAGAFKSDAVQGGLQSLFKTMAVLGRTVAPLVVQALGLIAPVLTALAPPAQRLIVALGSALSPILKALGPVLLAAAGAVGAIVDAALPLLPVVSQIVAGLGPLLTPVLRLVTSLFRAFAPVLKNLTTSLLPPLMMWLHTGIQAFKLIAPVALAAAKNFGQALTPVLSGLVKVLADMVGSYAPMFLSLLRQLLPVVPQLTPVVLQLGVSIGQILTALAPLIPQLTLLAVTLITQLLPAILPLIPVWNELERVLLRLTTGVITKVVIPVFSALFFVMSMMRRAMQPAVDAVTWATKAIAGAFQWLYNILLGHSIIPDIVNGTVRWFAGLPAKAAQAIASLPGKIAGVASDAARRLGNAVGSGISTALFMLGQLPGLAANAVGSLSGTLWNAGVHLISGLIGGIRAMIPSLTDLLGWISDIIPFKKGPPARDAVMLRPAGRLIMGGLMNGIGDQVPVLQRQLQGVSAMVAGAQIGAPGSAMGALVAPPVRPGYGSGSAGYGSASSSGKQQVEVLVKVVGNGDAWVTALRKSISVSGGDVQLVMGR